MTAGAVTPARSRGSDGRVSDGSRQCGTYEEYFPYGSTAWWAEKSGIQVSAKRYRYTGMEKDEETGLSYHSARYYATWLGRWCSADPIGMLSGVNRFGYVRNGPIGGHDPTGTQDTESDFLLPPSMMFPDTPPEEVPEPYYVGPYCAECHPELTNPVEGIAWEKHLIVEAYQAPFQAELPQRLIRAYAYGGGETVRLSDSDV